MPRLQNRPPRLHQTTQYLTISSLDIFLFIRFVSTICCQIVIVFFSLEIQRSICNYWIPLLDWQLVLVAMFQLDIQTILILSEIKSLILKLYGLMVLQMVTVYQYCSKHWTKYLFNPDLTCPGCIYLISPDVVFISSPADIRTAGHSSIASLCYFSYVDCKYFLSFIHQTILLIFAKCCLLQVQTRVMWRGRLGLVDYTCVYR